MSADESYAHFLGYESAELSDALFSIIPAPYEATASYVKGQAAAPWRILDASSQIEDYDEETSLSLIDKGIHVVDPGAAPEDEYALPDWVRSRVTEALDATAVPVILGGEGTVTLWGVQALLSRVDELSILHIDANADLNEPADGEEDHHTVMRRILELQARVSICQVGVRSLSRSAFERIADDTQPVETFFMADIERDADGGWQDEVLNELRSPVYLSIDLTGFDPAVIPGVSNPEPGGLGWWQVLRLVQRVAARRRIAAIDVTELCPREGLVRSDYAAARLVYKTMNYIHRGGKMLPKP